MSVGEICNRDVIVISENDSIHEAARRMRAHHAGALVVTAHGGLAGVVAIGRHGRALRRGAGAVV